MMIKLTEGIAQNYNLLIFKNNAKFRKIRFSIKLSRSAPRPVLKTLNTPI